MVGYRLGGQIRRGSLGWIWGRRADLEGQSRLDVGEGGKLGWIKGIREYFRGGAVLPYKKKIV